MGKSDITVIEKIDVSLSANRRWMNIAFNKNGKAFYGGKTWPTEEAARRDMEDVERLIAAGEQHIMVFLNGELPSEEYSHSTQVIAP